MILVLKFLNLPIIYTEKCWNKKPLIWFPHFFLCCSLSLHHCYFCVSGMALLYEFRGLYLASIEINLKIFLYKVTKLELRARDS